MKKNKKPLLMDCDGVVCDFHGGTFPYIKAAGINISHNDIKKDSREYEYWKAADLDRITKSPGFCSSLKPIDGAKEFVNKVRNKLNLDIIFVTSPMKDSPYWHWERQQWLKEHFDVKRTELIFAKDKRYVNGITLLDDHISNILDWQRYNQTSAMLIEQPWNEDILNDCLPEAGIDYDKGVKIHYHIEERTSVHRSNNWDSIFKFVDFKNIYENT